MGSDYLALDALANELNSTLKGARVDKIVQPEADEIRFFVRAGGRNECLVASCNAGAPRFHLTESRKANPVTAPNMCMLLRKYLSSAAIESISTFSNDRIIQTKFLARTEMRDDAVYFLFVEIMNRYSNIVFTDENMVILDAVKHLSFDDGGGHVVLRGAKYFPPEQPKPNYKTPEARALLDDFCGGDLHRYFLDKISGFSGATVSEILRRTEIEANCPTALDADRKQRLFGLLDELGNINESPLYRPCIIGGKDVYPFPYGVLKGEVKEFDTISHAYDAFNTKCDGEIRNKARLKNLSSAVKRLKNRTEKNIGIDRERLAECENMDKWRIMGELIVSNIYRVQKGDKVLKCLNYYTDEEVEIPLDERLSPSKNSAAYYNKYNKLKRTKEFTEKKLEDDIALFHYVSSIEEELRTLPFDASTSAIEEELVRLGAVKRKSQKSKVRKEKPEPPYEYEIEGFTVYAGKNNLQNEELTFRIAGGGDLWLHMKNAHGAHVVVMSGGKPVPESVVKTAAEIAAANAGANIEVDYTERRNVKRRPSGHPGQVIYTDYKTVVAKPDAHKELLVR